MVLDTRTMTGPTRKRERKGEEEEEEEEEQEEAGRRRRTTTMAMTRTRPIVHNGDCDGDCVAITTMRKTVMVVWSESSARSVRRDGWLG